MKEIILKIDGMMCTGCENRIKNALRDIEKVESVIADHTTSKVIVVADDDLSEDIVKETIKDIGYNVVGE